MLLQMKLWQEKGLLEFESNEIYNCVEVEFDEASDEPYQKKLREIFYDANERAETFYKKNLHPKLDIRLKRSDILVGTQFSDKSNPRLIIAPWNSGF